MESDQQAEIFRAMEAEDFYPHDVDAFEHLETHISKVFLAGPFVYKIKKAVDLGFLDFTTLQRRKAACRREIDLNRRLTRDVYHDLVSISATGSGYRMNGSKAPVEFAVKMRRLNTDDSMVHLLRNDGIDGGMITTLAGVLSEFYRAAESGPGIDALGSLQTVRKNCEENFSQMAPFAGTLIDAKMLGIIRAATRSFLRRQQPLFRRRIENGKIRDCHGDLRTEHVYFAEDGIQIIDCIEFNDRFRYGDIASDLAFLAMDLDFQGFPEVSGSLLTAYVNHAEDDDIFTLIGFYKCYRALVRAKVNCLQLDEGSSSRRQSESLLKETRRYMSLAYQYALQFTRPTIWIVCGMIASGKSTISMKLADKFNVRVFRSDIIRKSLFDVGSEQSMETEYGRGIYSAHATALTYGKLLRLAQEEIEGGESVILDASFSNPHFRQEALRLAEDMDANIMFIECAAKDATLRQRLIGREPAASVSDARLKHLERFKEAYTPVDEVPEDAYIHVNTDRPLKESMAAILASDYYLLAEQTASVIADRS